MTCHLCTRVTLSRLVHVLVHTELYELYGLGTLFVRYFRPTSKVHVFCRCSAFCIHFISFCFYIASFGSQVSTDSSLNLSSLVFSEYDRRHYFLFFSTQCVLVVVLESPRKQVGENEAGFIISPIRVSCCARVIALPRKLMRNNRRPDRDPTLTSGREGSRKARRE